MRIFLTIKNYRCFVRPVTIEITKGFTAFVGVNNAGKSTIMRFLLEFRPFFLTYHGQNSVAQLVNGQALNLQLLHVLDNLEVFSNLNANDIEFSIKFLYEGEETAGLTRHLEEEYLFVATRNMQVSAKLNVDGEPIRKPGNQIAFPNGIVSVNGHLFCRLSTISDALLSLAGTLYIGPFRNTINAGAKTDYLDIQIGQSFIAQFRELKTGSSKKSNADISRLTDDIRKVFQFESLDIAPTSDNLSLHLTVRRKTLQATRDWIWANTFCHRACECGTQESRWILIDEPELNSALDPALQLDFLTTLARYAEEGVWFSSHSIGLARSAAPKVYSVTRVREGDSDIRPLEGTPRLSEFLGEMSFSSHKELGFRKILLVEGPTEVPTIQQFLRMIGKDHQILLLPVHGHMPKADELEEILRISTEIAAVIDSEKVSESAPLNQDRQDFLSLCARKGLECCVLKKRAIENYFPDFSCQTCFRRWLSRSCPLRKIVGRKSALE